MTKGSKFALQAFGRLRVDLSRIARASTKEIVDEED
jgi:hypothetical protein